MAVAGIELGQVTAPRFFFTNKIREPGFRSAGEFAQLFAPGETNGAGVERVVFKYQSGTLLISKALLNEREIQILVTTIDFVAHDRMAEVREVDADLMLAARARPDAEEGERR